MTRRQLLFASLASPAAAQMRGSLPGTKPLDWTGDLSERMMDGAHKFVERKIAEAPRGRARFWNRDFSSPAAYEASVAANRARFIKIIGAIDPRVSPVAMERFGDDANPALVAETSSYRVYQVRWPALDGMCGEGLLLQPLKPAAGHVVALPDAGQTPEQIAGLASGIPREDQWARRMAEAGFEVVAMALIDRGSRWSGHADIQVTDQTHREWIYRQAFHMGRHVIGYEVQKVRAAVDWFAARRPATAKIGVAGYGEGGLIAFYSAAADTRIDAAWVSGYFDSRQAVWNEPIYRNVWGLLREFGDSEIATLIAPRALTIEYSRPPDITNQKGEVRTPPYDSVAAEHKRIQSLLKPGFWKPELYSGGGLEPLGPGSGQSVRPFMRQLADVAAPARLSEESAADKRASFDPNDRQKRLVIEAERYTQALIRSSERAREEAFLYKVIPELADSAWSMQLRHKTHAAERFVEGAKAYRKQFREEVLGKFDEPPLPPNPRTRFVTGDAKWDGYDVALDVFPDLFAWGMLLLPKDIKPGERRPVVVCQHGRRGLPLETVQGDTPYYHNFAARLADRGFIVFSPHNLYRGEDRYRWLSRKANGVKASLFSFIVSQHEQILRWLKSLPMVDGGRIGFYGLSYGGETAVRVPTVLEDYALSICSGDFNSWTEKVASTDQKMSFMYSIEWEMPYFDMGRTFDYAEMAYLMAPRPFMAERGHNDRVSRDHWVAREYAKVKWLYAQLGLGDKTEIELFNGGHTINAEGTFRFLHKHLQWPEGR